MNKMSKLLQAWDWLQKDDKSMGETVKKKEGKLQAWEFILSVRWHNFYICQVIGIIIYKTIIF